MGWTSLRSHLRELFGAKVESASDGSGRERKMSSSSTGSMKSKWLKAFKSLKTTTSSSTSAAPSANPVRESERKNQMYHAVSTIMAMRKNGRDAALANVEMGVHDFQEYTYKKITPCDVCSQVLRGHARQGVKCRLCKMNIHVDCRERVGRCSAKGRLLRRQKSSSEIESRLNQEQQDETPHSPRRQKLNLRMKSLSLDSPESTEHARRGRPANSHGHHGGTSSAGSGPHDPHSSHSSSSRLQSPSSPSHARRHLSARNMRMSSVELPDDNDKSQSSASTSPCPSPVRDSRVPGQKRLLPTNLYVVLFNFKARHQDELDLKAGYKVTVIDSTDLDWWKGKCLGRFGFFPSKYVTKLQPGERPLQVTHNLQVADGEDGLTLLRDQIVIQVGEELDGMVMIRSGDNRQGVCPLKFLQEV